MNTQAQNSTMNSENRNLLDNETTREKIIQNDIDIDDDDEDPLIVPA